MKFAAIDRGTNAVRPLFTQVFEDKDRIAQFSRRMHSFAFLSDWVKMCLKTA